MPFCQKLVYYFRIFTVIRKHLGLPKADLNSGVVFISSGLNSEISLCFAISATNLSSRNRNLGHSLDDL